MEDSVDKISFPGQLLCEIKEDSELSGLVLGPGLRNDYGVVYVTKPGVIRKKEPSFYWVDGIQKRYIPAKGDSILGTVTSKAGDNFKVECGASEQANLSYLAFEGATKKNRPNVKVGDLVFAKCSMVNKHLEPELVCIDSIGKSNGYGVISDGGYAFTCSINLARKLLRPDCPLLVCLGNHLPYEISIGVNGRIWIKGRSTGETIAVRNAILASEKMNSMEIRAMVKRLGRVVCHHEEAENSMDVT